MYSDYEGQLVIQAGQVIEDPALVQCYGNEGFVYEVIRILHGRPLLFRAHFERLMRSIALKGWTHDFAFEALKNDLKQLVQRNQLINQNIKIRVDRVGENLQIILYPIHSRYPSESLYHSGAQTDCIAIERKDPNAKAFDNNMLRLRAKLEESGLHELLLINHEGCVTEGSKSNVVFIRGHQLYSAPEAEILLGVTRSVLKHAVQREQVFEWIEGPIPQTELQTFDGAFLTGTSIHLLPISHIGTISYDTPNLDAFAALKALFYRQIEKEHEEDLW